MAQAWDQACQPAGGLMPIAPPPYLSKFCSVNRTDQGTGRGLVCMASWGIGYPDNGKIAPQNVA